MRASVADLAVSTRQAERFIDVIAVRRSGRPSRVRFSGLPVGVGEGAVLAHPGGNPSRPIAATRGAFTDPSPFRRHDARVYRFATG